MTAAVPFKPGQNMSPAHLKALGNEKGVTLFATGGTTTSATFANIPGNPTITFNKQLSNTVSRLWFDVHMSMYSTGAAIGGELQVTISGVTYTFTGFGWNAVNGVRQISRCFVFPNTVNSGSRSINFQWRRTAGAGTISQGSETMFSAMVAEVLL